MKSILMAGLALVGAGVLTSCDTAPPVREYVRPGVYRVDTVAPVGERYVVATPRVVFTRPVDRSYDIMNKQWERPWPYGPYGRGW